MAPGQNAWQILNRPQPIAPKTSHLRDADHSFPAITIVKLPITLEPTLPNAMINGIKLQGIDTKHSPLIRMFDNDGYQLLPDADANLHRGEQALPDILRLTSSFRQSTTRTNRSQTRNSRPTLRMCSSSASTTIR